MNLFQHVLIHLVIPITDMMCVCVCVYVCGDWLAFFRVYDNAQANAELAKAKLTLSMFHKASPCSRRNFDVHIHKHCSPQTGLFDDDEEEGATEQFSFLQKIAHKTYVSTFMHGTPCMFLVTSSHCFAQVY